MEKTAEVTLELSVKVTHAIPEQRIKDLLCSAMEGGCNYWVGRADPPAKRDRDPRAEYWHECPVYGQAVQITVGLEEDEVRYGKKFALDRPALERGFQVMADKYPQHMADFLKENDDACTADVFVQCCLFGDIIYG